MKPTAEDERIARITIGAWLDTLEYGRFPAGKLTELINRIASALAAEREKAAKIAEAHNDDPDGNYANCALAIAESIRAGDKE